MTNEYINRELALKTKVPYYSANGVEIVESEAVPVEYIENLPAADVVEVRHGWWIEDGDYQYCSECGEEHHWIDYRATYCDVCGAKMDVVAMQKGGNNDRI